MSDGIAFNAGFAVHDTPKNEPMQIICGCVPRRRPNCLKGMGYLSTEINWTGGVDERAKPSPPGPRLSDVKTRV